jgi:FemAB family
MRVDDNEILVTGKLIKIASIRDENLVDVEDADSLIAQIKKSSRKVDLFTFWQRLPHVTPKFNYYMEWDNVAAVPITTYDHWFRHQIDGKTRNKIRKAEKSGIDVQPVEFSDELVRCLVEIFNETPIRQGRHYSHYGKNFETVKREYSQHLHRSEFIAAYFHSELIGFIKLLYTGSYAEAYGTVAKLAYREHAPNNSLIAKAVSICEEKNVPYLVYGKLSYGKKGIDGLSNFKLNNGFEMISLPRYYVHLTRKGRVALMIKLHHGIANLLPRTVLVHVSESRKRWYTQKYNKDNS